MTRLPQPRLATVALVLVGALAGCSDDASSGTDADAPADDATTDLAGDTDAITDTPSDAPADPDTDATTDAQPGDARDLTADTDAAGDRGDDGPSDLGDDAADGATDATDTNDPDAVDADTAGDPDSSDAADLTDLADAGDVTDTEPDAALTCEELTTRIDSLRAAASTCVRSAQCAVRDNPLCPFGGCFTYYRAGVDLGPLDADETRFRLQSCSSMHCACPAQPPVPFCEDGTCTACPLLCPYECALDCDCVRDGCNCDLPLCQGTDPESCAALEPALLQAAEDVAGCSEDDECMALATGICTPAGCTLAVNGDAAVAHYEALAAAWEAGACGGDAPCVCPPATGPATCVEGRCQLP